MGCLIQNLDTWPGTNTSTFQDPAPVISPGWAAGSVTDIPQYLLPGLLSPHQAVGWTAGSQFMGPLRVGRLRVRQSRGAGWLRPTPADITKSGQSWAPHRGPAARMLTVKPWGRASGWGQHDAGRPRRWQRDEANKRERFSSLQQGAASLNFKPQIKREGLWGYVLLLSLLLTYKHLCSSEWEVQRKPEASKASGESGRFRNSIGTTEQPPAEKRLEEGRTNMTHLICVFYFNLCVL